jgi:hypothetical protein
METARQARGRVPHEHQKAGPEAKARIVGLARRHRAEFLERMDFPSLGGESQRLVTASLWSQLASEDGSGVDIHRDSFTRRCARSGGHLRGGVAQRVSRPFFILESVHID